MITGRTRLIAHLGLPTEGFKSPMIYNPYFESRGIEAVVVPMGCEEADFPLFLRHLFRLRNIAGALVTMPYKMTAAELVDEASTAVKICGACNAVRKDADGRLIGDMFDGAGFVRSVTAKLGALGGKAVIIAGSGGVGSAIAAAFAAEGVGHIALFDPREGASENLMRKLVSHYRDLNVTTDSNDPDGFDIVVNATPLGMDANDPLPFRCERLKRGALAGEVVMRKELTPFLEAARRAGCTVQTGTEMLFQQIPAYLEFFGFPVATPEELRAVARLDPFEEMKKDALAISTTC
ncbi:MAG: shikimate dehydrogenase [Rhizobiaceae bacterium]